MGRTIRIAILAALAAALVLSGRAEALVVTYDLGSNRGPITLRFEADDADADTRLRFQRGQADISSLLDITLTVGGTEYDLIGAVDPDVGLLDRRERSIAFVVADSVRPWANTLTTVNLSFSASMNRIRSLGDLFAYLESAQIIGGRLTIAPAAAVPVPGAAWLFAAGLGGLARCRWRACQAG